MINFYDMLSKIKSASLLGIDAIHIQVEVDCALGLTH